MIVARMRVVVPIVGGFVMLFDIDKSAGGRWTTSISTTFLWRATDEACGFLRETSSASVGYFVDRKQAYRLVGVLFVESALELAAWLGGGRYYDSLRLNRDTVYTMLMQSLSDPGCGDHVVDSRTD